MQFEAVREKKKPREAVLSTLVAPLGEVSWRVFEASKERLEAIFWVSILLSLHSSYRIADHFFT